MSILLIKASEIRYLYDGLDSWALTYSNLQINDYRTDGPHLEINHSTSK